MIKKVLIATDGSEHATKAVAFGADIAAKYGAELIILHILLRHELPRDLKRFAEVEHLSAGAGMRSPPIPISAPAPDLGSYLNLANGDVGLTADILGKLGEKIVDRAEKTARDHGVEQIAKRIEDGKPVDQILEIAKSENVDLIVTGARGLSDLQALVCGSVSHKLSQLSPVTCLSVR
jgi:nucleotide-binding universal stress UspA family protein